MCSHHDQAPLIPVSVSLFHAMGKGVVRVDQMTLHIFKTHDSIKRKSARKNK
jgi:hypothetical protein